ncbi:NAD(P)-binding protein, partial [Gymnopus androsaceus JB14]
SPIRIGFVGLSEQGWASMMLAPSLLKSSQYRLTAVSTSNPTSASISAQKYSELSGEHVDAFHGSAEGIANSPNVDMVAVAVKPWYHKEQAMKVIDAGKDLFLEWPVGRLSETMEIADAARQKGIRALVGLQGRQTPVIQKLKSIIESGQIGKVLSTSVVARPARETFTWGPFVNAASPETASIENGTTMLDIAVGHFLDSLTFTLGNITSVSAIAVNQFPVATLVDANGKPTGETTAQNGFNQVAAGGVLESGAVWNIHFRGGLETRAGKAGTPMIWTIDGDKGSIRLESDHPMGFFMQIAPPTMYVNGEQVDVGDDELGAVGRAWYEFANEGSYATLEDAVRMKKVILAIGKSANEG